MSAGTPIVSKAQPPQRFVDLGALDLQLTLVGNDLPRRAGMVSDRRDPLGARLQHLDDARVGVAALALVDDRSHAIAGDGAGDEHHVASRLPVPVRGCPGWGIAEPCDPLTAEGERIDLQLELVPALRADAQWRIGFDVHTIAHATRKRTFPDRPLYVPAAAAAADAGDTAARGAALETGATSISSSAFCAWRRFSAWSQMRWRVP